MRLDSFPIAIGVAVDVVDVILYVKGMASPGVVMTFRDNAETLKYWWIAL
jgi:hypothetical protein